MDSEIIYGLIENMENYDAHILENEENGIETRESLKEHIDLTMKYFSLIWEEKCGSEMLERFSNRMWESLTVEGKRFLEDMIFGIPLFHDLGKINSEFQIRKMKNYRAIEKNVFPGVAGQHSMISAVLYINYFLEDLKKRVENKEDKKKLRFFIMVHAYMIERHHSDLMEFEEFLTALEGAKVKEIIQAFQTGKCEAYRGEFLLSESKMGERVKNSRKYTSGYSKEQSIDLYCYTRMLYSLLVTSDYYATSEFMSGIQMKGLDNRNDFKEWIEVYENTNLMKSIRKYQNEEYPKCEDELKKTRNINVLRTEMLSDAERVLARNMKEVLFYLEAPTGSGKSNTAMDLCFQMMKGDKRLSKIYYIYPFNTLVEQNRKNLQKIFGGEPEIFNSIAVVNSLTPIKMTESAKKEESESEQTMYYQKALLDRQFLNYPMILSTHVSLFDMMFGDTKESAFGFHQFMNSIIVLDEIQSYKNTIWSEIICFLKEFSYLLNMKVIIMSATLPDLDLLSKDTFKAVKLMEDKEKYFSNPCFKDRVQISYELLNENVNEDMLLEHVKASACQSKKVLVEFIKKESAFRFYGRLLEENQGNYDVEYMSGDDSLMERSRILNTIKENKKAVILVATQVIEAGVDIDMDIGYKNISKLDSEEQFLGRINRSCLRNGVVYFFKSDDGKNIYEEDIRIEQEFTLENEAMREVLTSKEFSVYYEQILGVLEQNYNRQVGEGGIEPFFKEKVGNLHWPYVKKRMELIPEDNWSMSVYLARRLTDEEGKIMDGKCLWESYVDLLKDFSMGYAEKKVKLSGITSQMNHFIYQIRRNRALTYNDKVGEIFYIEDGEQYFEKGKLNRKKIQGDLGEFVDFI